MSAKPFLDTTILVYAVSADAPRAAIAQEILAAGGAISVQVLNEFASVARRKLKKSWKEIAQALDLVREVCEPASPLTIDVHEIALGIAAEHGYNIYDALILAAAIDTGCALLYTEDMQHGQRIRGLRIVNPFRTA